MTTTMKVFSLLALCTTACMTREATAQQGAGKYPEKSLRLILPFAPGGGTDLLARTLAQRLTEGHLYKLSLKFAEYVSPLML